MITLEQKAATQALVNVFETGSPAGDYGAVAVLKGDAGHLTYGRSQTTLASGGLYTLLAAYCATPGAKYADALEPYLPRLQAKEPALDDDARLKRVLRDAGGDPVMRATQDGFFDAAYWDPSVRAADALGITTALGVAVIYDSHIHGSWALIRDRVKLDPAADERAWIVGYIAARREWLATHSNPILHASVRRMDAFSSLIADGNWDLAMPLLVRGMLVTPETIAGAPQPPVLKLGESGAAVAELRALLDLEDDTAFDEDTDKAVQEFQKSVGLKPDGIVGAQTWCALLRREDGNPALEPDTAAAPSA